MPVEQEKSSRMLKIKMHKMWFHVKLLLLCILLNLTSSLPHFFLEIFQKSNSNDFVAFLQRNGNTTWEKDSKMANFVPRFSALLKSESEFESLLKNDYANAHSFWVVMLPENCEQAVQFLIQISNKLIQTNETASKYAKRFQLFLAIQNYDESVEKAIAKFRKLLESQPIVHHFDLNSAVFLGFPHWSTEKHSQLKFNVWEFYTIKTIVFLEPVGENVRSKHLGRFLESKSLRASERQDWKGVEIRAAPFMLAGAIDHAENFTEVEGVTKYEVNLRKNLKTGELKLKKSLSARIFWDFQRALNFTSKLTSPFNYSSGMGKVIAKHGHTFDIVISHFSLVAQKLKIAENLEPTYFNGITAFFVQPPAHTFRNIYTVPFKVELWGMIVLTWLGIGLSFHVIRYIRQIANYDINPDINRDEQVTNEWLWWAIGAFCQQGWYSSPGSTPARLVFATGLLFSLLCYAAYTATIVSELWKTVVPIRDLDTLFTSSKAIFMEADSDVSNIVVEELLQRNPKFISKLRLIDSSTSQSWVNYLFRAGKGKSCFLSWPEYFIDDAKTVLETTKRNKSPNVEVEFCKHFSSFPYKYIPVKAAMFVHKGSPFTKILNFRILIGRERGLLYRYWLEYQHITTVHCLSNTNKSYALGIYDTWAVFAILVLGYAISMCILSIEIMVYKYANAKLKN